MIRFGSRVDLYFENYQPLVRLNQKTISGETIIAKKKLKMIENKKEFKLISKKNPKSLLPNALPIFGPCFTPIPTAFPTRPIKDPNPIFALLLQYKKIIFFHPYPSKQIYYLPFLIFHLELLASFFFYELQTV